ncbi:MAG: hypothetical protein KDE34_00035 [Anaerolineales bacterium]|nr:hypothetical protein [Anaerolineales bacterium]
MLALATWKVAHLKEAFAMLTLLHLFPRAAPLWSAGILLFHAIWKLALHIVTAALPLGGTHQQETGPPRNHFCLPGDWHQL